MTTPRTCIVLALSVSALCAGCSVQRQPLINVKPTYSILRDSVALENHMGGPPGRSGLAVAGADLPASAW